MSPSNRSLAGQCKSLNNVFLFFPKPDAHTNTALKLNDSPIT